jgi:hypothetical protein
MLAPSSVGVKFMGTYYQGGPKKTLSRLIK